MCTPCVVNVLWFTFFVFFKLKFPSPSLCVCAILEIMFKRHYSVILTFFQKKKKKLDGMPQFLLYLTCYLSHRKTSNAISGFNVHFNISRVGQ